MDSTPGADADPRDRLPLQTVVADLGQHALGEPDLESVFSEASAAVAAALETEYAAVFESVADGEDVHLRAGTGWPGGPTGSVAAPIAPDLILEEALVADSPVVREDLRARSPADRLPDDVAAGVGVPIDAAAGQWGVLGAYATAERTFDAHEVAFLESVATVLAGAIDRTARERRLERDRAWTDEILASVDDVVYVFDETGTFRRWNETLTAVTGYADEAVADMSPLEFIAPADREAVATEIARVFQTGSSRVEASVLTKDGTEIPYEFSASRLEAPDGTPVLAGIGRDVSERVARERELARFRRAVEAAGHAIYMTNPDGEITYVNPAFEETTGYAAAEAVGETPRILQSGEHEDAYYRDLWETVRAGEVWEEEIVDRRKDGELYYAEQTIAPVTDDRGEIDRFVAVQTDVTERKEDQRALEELVEKLETSNERLEGFAYAASHDLQEPLRMVSSYLRLIERRYGDALDAEGEEFLAFAVDGADRMREMIDGLLEYSRVETRGGTLEPVELSAVFEAVLEDLQVKIDTHDAVVSAGTLPRVRGDEGQLRQVFQNLLANAIEYSGDDRPRVRVDAERTGADWTVSVADEGVGIHPDDQERIFEVFERIHDPDGRAGTGIGLAICERIVERHDGDIWVESVPGEGATFSFTLPAAGDGG